MSIEVVHMQVNARRTRDRGGTRRDEEGRRGKTSRRRRRSRPAGQDRTLAAPRAERKTVTGASREGWRVGLGRMQCKCSASGRVAGYMRCTMQRLGCHRNPERTPPNGIVYDGSLACPDPLIQDRCTEYTRRWKSLFAPQFSRQRHD